MHRKFQGGRSYLILAPKLRVMYTPFFCKNYITQTAFQSTLSLDCSEFQTGTGKIWNWPYLRDFMPKMFLLRYWIISNGIKGLETFLADCLKNVPQKIRLVCIKRYTFRFKRQLYTHASRDVMLGMVTWCSYDRPAPLIHLQPEIMGQGKVGKVGKFPLFQKSKKGNFPHFPLFRPGWNKWNCYPLGRT